MAKYQIKFGLRDRQKFFRPKKAFYLYSGIDGVVESRPTGKGEARVRILLWHEICLSFQRRVAKAIGNLFTSFF